MSLKAIVSNTVLVVDDTPSNLQVLFTYLENEGFRVLLAQSGSRALDIIKYTLPDLILLDILMPDIDGFELCSQLKKQKSTQEIPIIFLTALSETTYKIKGFAVGGVDYITKPIEQQEVIARIKTHLALRNVRQRLINRNQELQQEITSRQKIEAKLQRALDSEASIRRITEKIRDSFDEKQVLQTITQELVKVLDLSGCQIEFYDDNFSEPWKSQERQSLTIMNERGQTFNSVGGIIKQIADYPQIHRQLAQKISLQLVTQMPQLDSTRVQSTCLVCPIFDNQNPISIMGNLWLLRPPEEIFDSWEVKLVEQVANQCAISIRQARLYQTSQIQVKELAKLNRLKDDFLKTISHELRSPMSSIQLAVQTLEKLLIAEYTKPQSMRFQRVLTIFRQSCNRQNQSINDLLTLCHLDAQAETIATDWIDLPTWIPEVVQSFQERAKIQQQELILEIPPNLAPVYSDPFILERIVQELINNACKYTPARKVIVVKAMTAEDKVTLIVQNTGISIPLEEQERIFDRFYRIPNNDPWQYGGTGLGLYLVKRLLELLQGKISVASQAETTQFTVELERCLFLES